MKERESEKGKWEWRGEREKSEGGRERGGREMCVHEKIGHCS